MMFRKLWLRITRSRRSEKAAELLGCEKITIENNTAEFVFKHPAFAHIIEEAANIIDDKGAVNYVVMESMDSKYRRIQVIIQKLDWPAITPDKKAEIALSHLKAVLRHTTSKDDAVIEARYWVASQTPHTPKERRA